MIPIPKMCIPLVRSINNWFLIACYPISWLMHNFRWITGNAWFIVQQEKLGWMNIAQLITVSKSKYKHINEMQQILKGCYWSQSYIFSDHSLIQRLVWLRFSVSWKNCSHSASLRKNAKVEQKTTDWTTKNQLQDTNIEAQTYPPTCSTGNKNEIYQHANEKNPLTNIEASFWMRLNKINQHS